MKNKTKLILGSIFFSYPMGMLIAATHFNWSPDSLEAAMTGGTLAGLLGGNILLDYGLDRLR